MTDEIAQQTDLQVGKSSPPDPPPTSGQIYAAVAVAKH